MTKKPAPKPASKRTSKPAPKSARKSATKPNPKSNVTLLSGGNPQIAKADGDAPVQAYIAAMPDWKRHIGRRLDALITRVVPKVRKAVKWNSPFYGLDGQGWFLSFHTFANYVKVAFFKGSALDPLPPDESKSKDTRYLNVRETWGTKADEAQFTDWVAQASRLPGWSGS